MFLCSCMPLCCDAVCSFMQLDRFDDFFAAYGQRCILLYYQEAPTPVAGVC